MLFFRVMLCVVGLLLYLVIKEFSDEPVATPGQDALRPVPPVLAAETIPAMPWDAARIGTLQPVAAKPADGMR